MNTDQGSRFTRSAWIKTLIEAGLCVSMHRHRHDLDNIFIERLWQSLKQEAISLEEISDGFKAGLEQKRRAAGDFEFSL